MSERTWQGDWITRIYQRVHERGFESVTAFAETKPTATLLELAAELGEGVAAIQLEGVLYSEAEKSGTFDKFARGLLARCIREWIPTGWTSGDQFETQRVDAFVDWSVIVSSHIDESRVDAIWEALKTINIPEGWLPEGPDDPILARAFAGVQFHAPAGE